MGLAIPADARFGSSFKNVPKLVQKYFVLKGVQKMQHSEDDTREKLEDLKSSLTVSNAPWNAWELEFIKDITKHLENTKISLSEKQLNMVIKLWDKL